MIVIVVTGPESTGKTLISEFLSKKLNGFLVPEFAREYISDLNRKYTYGDVEIIAKTQINQRRDIEKQGFHYVIFDTWLIITKIWFTEVYGRYPSWIDEAISRLSVDLYLLCKPDIPWVPDPVRENGGERRVYLYEKYKEEIIRTHAPFEIVTGFNKIRYTHALEKVKMHF